MDLLSLKPNKVSRDLSGYITFVYGRPKTGKTTLASQMDGALLLAFEPGYHALPGVVAQDITSWSEMKQAYRELKKPEVREHFKAIIVDTIDIAYECCMKYICSQNGIEDLGELNYGKGWTKFKKEFNEVFRGLTQLGYAVFFIGHDKEVTVKDDGTNTEHVIMRPALSASARTVIAGMADIYAYAHQKSEGEMSVLTLRSTDGSIECGSRFKYLKDEIPCNYHVLVSALQEAIDKEAAEHDGKFVTNERVVMPEAPTYNFEELMAKFQTLCGDLISANQSNAAKITAIVDKNLGKGRKVSDCTEEQCEQIDYIVHELEQLIQG